MSIWYRVQDGKQAGPFTDEIIREQCRSGSVKRSDKVWKEGQPAWQPAGETELAAYLPTPQPPQQPPIHSSAPPTPPSAFQPASTSMRMVMPRNPPRSVGWMTFWGFIWPGLGQILCGQGSKGGVLMAASVILNMLLSVTVIIPVAICVAGAIDANKVAKRLAKGQPVGEWEFFPASQ